MERRDSRDFKKRQNRWYGVPTLVLILLPILLVWSALQYLLYKNVAHGFKATLQQERDDAEVRRLRGNGLPFPAANHSAVLQHNAPVALHEDVPTESSSPGITRAARFPPAPPLENWPRFSEDEWFEMEWTYLADEKDWPYVGNPTYLDMFPKDSRSYLNSVAVFPYSNATRMHGLLGILPDGTQAWQPAPRPPVIHQFPGGRDAALKNGGFYYNLSEALPLDRDPVDGRDKVCLAEEYSLADLEDITVIITFYNEPLSTLLRSVHSVLNRTPPSLLREILLVDDHSNITVDLAGGPLDHYVRLLPKVKLMRMPERRGLVWARLAGAKLAKAPVVVVLDSHIEVNDGWLEPQLQRLRESPKSIVFPQIMAIDNDHFGYQNQAGIGCFLSFKWVMQEKASLTGNIADTSAIPSPSMAGGLFAVRRDWFWELGGYDEEFGMWGAENVEMGFRTWMCGGRLECTPCARVYHIYRKGGHAYKSPPQSLWRNRLRTARIWTDEFYQIAEKFTHHPGFDLGNMDKMLEMKERLNCKDFKWYLETVDPKHEVKDLDDIAILGEFKNRHHHNICIDTLSNDEVGKPWGLFWCHHTGGTQGFLMLKGAGKIRSFTDEFKCLGKNLKITNCQSREEDSFWSVEADATIRWKAGQAGEQCLSMVIADKSKAPTVENCDPANNPAQFWDVETFHRDPHFQLPDYSPQYKAAAAREGRIIP